MTEIPSTPAAAPPLPAASDRDASAREMGRTAALISAGTLASRILGMLRESLIAAMFDVASTDAFFIAWRVPNALRAMLAEGAARNILNPVLGDALHGEVPGAPENRERLRSTVARIRAVALLVLLATTALGVIFARPFFSLISGGFDGDATRFELGTRLLRILFPYIFFMGAFAVGNSTLQTLRIIRPGAFAPVLLNVAFVVLPFGLIPVFAHFGYPAIYALAVSALVGGALQLAWLEPALRREGMTPRPRFEIDDSVREMGRLFLPQLAGQAVYQIDSIIASRFLADLPRGAASYYSYAQRIADIPQGLFSVAISGALALALQRYAAQKNFDALARTYEEALRMAGFVAIPVTVIIAVYAEAIIPLIYGYGHFARLGATGVHQIAASLRWQAISIAVLAFVMQTTTALGSLKLKKVVVIGAACSVVVFVSVGAFAAPRFGHVGVAQAITCATAVQLVYLLVAVRTVIPVRFSAVGPSLAKVLAATGVTALAARAAVTFLPVTAPTLGAKVLAIVCGAALVGLYLAAAWILRCDEMITLADKFARRLGPRPG